MLTWDPCVLFTPVFPFIIIYKPCQDGLRIDRRCVNRLLLRTTYHHII